MKSHHAIRSSSLMLHGGFGAFMGLVIAGLLLVVDAFGFGSMMQQVEQPVTHLFLLMIKPAMLFGLIGLGWSMMRQLVAGHKLSSLG